MVDQTSTLWEFVAIYRTNAVVDWLGEFICGKVKCAVIKAPQTYQIREYRPTVLAAIPEAEYRIPLREPLVLPGDIPHLVLKVRTPYDPMYSEHQCNAEIDSVVAILSVLVTPDLFRTELLRGWIFGPSPQLLGLVKFVSPIQFDSRTIPGRYQSAMSAMRKVLDQPDRLRLMARFVRKGLAESPREEAFIWLWTALEVFPMANTSNIAPISDLLEIYLKVPAKDVKDRLKIGWLFGLRSSLVHDGHLPIPEDEALSALERLEQIVLAVLRHAAGLGYDRALDSWLVDA